MEQVAQCRSAQQEDNLILRHSFMECVDHFGSYDVALVNVRGIRLEPAGDMVTDGRAAR